MRLSCTRGLSALILSCCFTTPLFATDSAFRQGIDAFKQGDYDTALDHFQQARSIGNPSAQLLYNTGVTYYKLGRHGEAEDMFNELARIDGWRGIAHYNLGVIAERQGYRGRAAEHYRSVLAYSDDSKLRHLATNRLVRLEPRRDRARSDRHFGLVSVVGGRDDNVVALPDDLQRTSSGVEDDFYELLGYFQFYAAGNRGNGWRVDALGYQKSYSEFESYDVAAYQLGVTRETQFSDWQLNYGVAVDRTDVDGEELTTDLRLELAAHTILGEGRFTVYYRPRFSDAGSDYPQLDGEEHRLGVKWHRYGNGWDWRVGYRLEIHDKDDLQTDTAYFSYSPTRHRVATEYSVDVTKRLTAAIGALYEFSQYDDKNRQLDADGVFKVAERERTKSSLWLQAEYDVTSSLQGVGEIKYTDYDDEFELYTYDQLEFSLGAEYIF